MRVVVAKITSLAKGMLVSSETGLDALIDSNGIALPGLGELTESDERRVRSKAIALSLEALRLSREDQTTIDFDDMIWFPNIFDVRCTKYARIFVDETQDLNAAQVKLALKACELGGRICAVGDPAQAIYGFRGADSMAIKKLTAKLNAKTLPLSITYRCARAIVALAREYVPDFEAAPDAPTGSVTETTDAIMLRDVAPGDFILSRTNAPLVTYAFALYRQGRPAHIQGRDLSTHLKAIIARAKTENVADFLAKTETWRAKEVKRLLDLDRDTSMTEDTAECLVALAEDCTSVSEIGEKVDTLFADLTGDGHDRIVLSSTHKAKGLERDRVWLLRDTFMRRPGDEEKNLFYVAVTRAKNDLRLVRTTKA
jgi:superfamily I DNA/RNA helicase